MGNSMSKQRVKETALNWGSAIYRRLNIWRELKPAVLGWMNITGSGI
jgi:hypothetical protein